MHRVHDLRATGDAPDRQSAAEALRGGDEIGHDIFVLARKPGTCAAECGLHLVCDEHDAVRLAPFVEAGEPTGLGNDEPTFACDRFDHDARDAVGTNGRLQEPDGVVQLAGLAERIRVGSLVDLGSEGPESVLVGHRLSGESHPHERPAVKSVVERDHRAASRRVPRDLHRVLHRFSAGVDEERPLLMGTRSQLVQLLADLHVALVGGHLKAGVREFPDLVCDRLHDLGRTVADIGHRDP